jgi:hypothetical protein
MSIKVDYYKGLIPKMKTNIISINIIFYIFKDNYKQKE